MSHNHYSKDLPKVTRFHETRSIMFPEKRSLNTIAGYDDGWFGSFLFDGTIYKLLDGIKVHNNILIYYRTTSDFKSYQHSMMKLSEDDEIELIIYNRENADEEDEIIIDYMAEEVYHSKGKNGEKELRLSVKGNIVKLLGPLDEFTVSLYLLVDCPYYKHSKKIRLPYNVSYCESLINDPILDNYYYLYKIDIKHKLNSEEEKIKTEYLSLKNENVQLKAELEKLKITLEHTKHEKPAPVIEPIKCHMCKIERVNTILDKCKHAVHCGNCLKKYFEYNDFLECPVCKISSNTYLLL